MMKLRTNLFMVALGLALLGLTMVYSATAEPYGPTYLMTHLSHLVLGLAVFAVVSRVRYPAWRRLAPWVYGGSLLSLILVLIPGVGVVAGGARRWLEIGPLSLQPSEFAKLAAIIVLSCAVSKGYAMRKGAGLLDVSKPLLAIGVLLGLILLQPDFDTTVVLVAGLAGVLLASELRTRGLFVAAGVGLVALTGVMVAEPYRRERLFSYLDPWSDAQGDGYQIVQALSAIKSGGLLGAGPGAGEMSETVPEIGTDMIFALIGEELGLPGMLAVIGGFCFIALAGLKIALGAPSVLGRCMAAGIATVLVVQATLNMGATLGVLPLSGMTLPFISSGGSSIMVSFAAVAILYRISEDSERATDVKPKRGSRSGERPAAPRERTPRRAAAGDDSGRRYGRTRDPRAVRSG